jgi:hypothetical protein
VSLLGPGARPIKKGRIGKPVEFAYLGQVVDNEDGAVVDHGLHIGNPADGPLLAPAVGRVKRLARRAPREVNADLRSQALLGLVEEPHGRPRKGRAGVHGPVLTVAQRDQPSHKRSIFTVKRLSVAWPSQTLVGPAGVGTGRCRKEVVQLR